MEREQKLLPLLARSRVAVSSGPSRITSLLLSTSWKGNAVVIGEGMEDKTTHRVEGKNKGWAGDV